jgi:hypothetical protein
VESGHWTKVRAGHRLLEWLQTRTFLAADIFKAGVLFAALSAAKDWETMVQISEVKGNNKTVVHIF